MFLLYKFACRKMASFRRIQMNQDANAVQGHEKSVSLFHKAQQQLRRFVEHDWFSRVFMGFILINTVAMVRFQWVSLLNTRFHEPMLQKHV